MEKTCLLPEHNGYAGRTFIFKGTSFFRINFFCGGQPASGKDLSTVKELFSFTTFVVNEPTVCFAGPLWRVE